MPRGTASRGHVSRAERAARALELRKAGMTFRQIGQEMGFTEQRAHAVVTHELARLNAKRAEDGGTVTRLEVERLDAMLAAVWPKALAGDLPSFDRVLAVLARRAKLLGIDAEKPATGVTMQNINVEMTDRERADAIRAVLSRVGDGGPGPHPETPSDEARPLLGHAAAAADGGGPDAGRLADGAPPLFG
jgi:hypothetical protein